VGKNTVIDIKQRFGQAMRQRRREMDISQEELADRAGLHRTYISDVERGDRNLSLENIEKITQALELKISEFFAQCES
jgi:transcriptional regulator with XRE-family HTH domain